MSEWDVLDDDTCEHCGSKLTLESEIKEDIPEEKEESILNIKPGDSLIIVILKKTGWVLQMIFIAIMSFFIWFISIITG